MQLLKRTVINYFRYSCYDLSLQDFVAEQTKYMRATVTVQLFTLTKFEKRKQKLILLNSEQFDFLTLTC